MLFGQGERPQIVVLHPSKNPIVAPDDELFPAIFLTYNAHWRPCLEPGAHALSSLGVESQCRVAGYDFHGRIAEGNQGRQRQLGKLSEVRKDTLADAARRTIGVIDNDRPVSGRGEEPCLYYCSGSGDSDGMIEPHPAEPVVPAHVE